MYVTEIQENKFRPLNQTLQIQEVIHQIQDLEFMVNIESPRTQKAINNLGLSKDMLFRRTIVEFQRKNEDHKMQHQRFIQHLFELKDNLKNVLLERNNIKQILRQRKIEEEGIQPFYQSKPKKLASLDQMTLVKKCKKIDREREKEQMIRENAAKDEIIKELKRRKTLEIWDKKIDSINLARDKNLELKVKAISTKNLRVSQVNFKQKEKEQEMINEKFSLSQTFSEKFIPRINKINELKQKKVEEIVVHQKKKQDQILLQRIQLEQKRNQLEQVRLKKDLEQELRFQLEKENYKSKLQNHKKKQEEYLQRVQESGNQQNDFAAHEFINSFGQKMHRRDSNQDKKNAIVEVFLQRHKKAIVDKFVRQKTRLERITEKNEEHLKAIEEEQNQRDEQIQKFLEMKVIESNVKNDMSQQKQRKQHQLLMREQNQLKSKEDEILRKGFQKQEKVEQQRNDFLRLTMHSKSAQQKSELEGIQQSKEMEEYKYKASSQLFQKLQSFNYIKQEELEAIKQEFFASPIKQSAHKSPSSSQQNFFPQQ